MVNEKEWFFWGESNSIFHRKENYRFKVWCPNFRSQLDTLLQHFPKFTKKKIYKIILRTFHTNSDYRLTTASLETIDLSVYSSKSKK